MEVTIPLAIVNKKFDDIVFRPCRNDGPKDIVQCSTDEAEFYGVYIVAKCGVGYELHNVADAATASDAMALVLVFKSLIKQYNGK